MNISAATGVAAVIKLPRASDVYGYDSTEPSAGDIYMFNQSGGGGFVQIGWYVGSASGLPVATQRRVFWGENTPTGETLHAGAVLNWGQACEFMITNPLDGTGRFNV